MALLLPCVLVTVLWLLAPICDASTDSTQSIVVEGAGSTVPLALYLNAFFGYRFEDSNVQVKFDSTTVDQAVCRLMNYSKECAHGDTDQPWYLDWASLVSPLSSDYYQRYPDLQLYPTVASAVVPIYNLNGVADLVLTMETLAKIWSGRITTWDHPDIQATNPNFTAWNVPANQPITLVARSDRAGATEVFKKALAGTDAVFRSQVGTDPAPSWNGTQVVFQTGASLLISYVMRNSYTLGYSPMGDAKEYEMLMAKLNRSGVIVEASTDSVEYAMLERGLSFGDNGDAAVHLTADIYNAVNPLAWPIASYCYVAVRKSTLRPGATCATVAALVSFWLWFWNSDEVESLASSSGFSVLPTVIKNLVVARFKQDMWCGGSRVWQEEEVPVIQGYGPGSAILIFDEFQEAYRLVNSSVALNYTPLASDEVDVTSALQAGGFIVSTSPISSTDAVNLVLAAEAVVTISRFVLTLDGLTLAKILNGDIQTWLHKDIVALNPNGIRDSSGNLLNDTTQRIVLLQGPTAGSAPMTALLQSYYPAYTGAAILLAEKFASAALLWAAVLGTPYSFSVSAFVGQLPEELQFASIISGGGIAVAPSLATATACADNATYSSATHSVILALDNRSCYPLLLPLYVSLQRQCPMAMATTARAVDFLQWMFKDATLEATLEALNLVCLDDVSSEILADNKEALFQLSCGVRAAPAADITTLLLAVIIPIAAVVLIGVAACGWWLWRVTENNRAMRKKFSNDNVAESCAEAIARFDLVAVAWLKEVKEPNKIQKAFLAIITLLTEVKPYIPDQLLSRLTASKAAEDDNDAETATISESNHRSFRGSCRRDRRLSLRTSHSSMSKSNSCKKGSYKIQRDLPSLASSDTAKQPLPMKDWTRKRCTYMCVRFGSTFPNAERRLLGLAQVVGRIVDVAKSNGATIDAVGVDFVNVHWGVTSMFGPSSAKAVQAGLEMEQLRDTLPEDQQAAFWLQMGIGKGVCDCGSVSSESGHRFFVVWGTEASLALEVAMTNLPKRVLASLLVSPSVFQEVQFTVECMPRMWHGEVLLWEPRYVLKKEDDDEWMYELKKMNEDSSMGHKALLDVFLMAKGESASATDLSAHIAELQALQGGRLSAQDMASLELLLAMVRNRSLTGDMVLDDAAP